MSDADGPDGTVVGVTAADGVLLAASTRATEGTTVTAEAATRLWEVHPTAVLGAAGELGPASELAREVRSDASQYETERDRPMDAGTLARAVEAALAVDDVDLSLLVGVVDDDGPHLRTVDRASGALAVDAAAVGAGRELATGALEASYHEGPALPAARDVLVEAYRAAAERETTAGVGVQLATVTADGVETERHDAVDALEG